MTTEADYQYLFGPVPSRRLGRSLGVDIVPFKTCTQNCIYCQLGKDADTVIERAEYVSIDAVLAELDRKIAEGLAADVITISGSGEPTLNSGLGRLIDGIKQRIDTPVVVITNGTLLSQADVRADCAKADIVMPSLDAGDAETFIKMNHPHPNLDFDTFVDGLVQFRRAFQGKYWLEVFFCDHINTAPASVDKMKAIIDRIAPDKIQLNTSVRPVVHAEAAKASRDQLEEIARRIGGPVEVIADFSKQSAAKSISLNHQAVLEMIRRRPCSLDDICNGLGIDADAATPILDQLSESSTAVTEIIDGKTYYKAP
ncbi:MAG: radical SAM protein [Planctomycetota bacterium]|jgi:wyosine [tRNA(Phe)-imidazoG37] synthetase (radical SAM superfamily)